MIAIPDALLRTTFTTDDAAAHGISRRMLQGQRFVRVYPRVYRVREFAPSHADLVRAAAQSLPADAVVTGITRLQVAGLDHGPRWPLRFVVPRDLHVDLPDVFLHRTVAMPPVDDVGATPAAAFLSYCTAATLLDAAKVGSWLLRSDPGFDEQVRTLALSQRWRDGADEAVWILPHLDARCRSLPETELRLVLQAAGLHGFTPDVPIRLADGQQLIGDLLHESGLLLEYEGSHHQQDRGQYLADVDRYASLRSHGIPYEQVTKERLRQRALLLGDVHRRLIACGYDGPPPEVAGLSVLGVRVRDLVGPRRRPTRRERVD